MRGDAVDGRGAASGGAVDDGTVDVSLFMRRCSSTQLNPSAYHPTEFERPLHESTTNSFIHNEPNLNKTSGVVCAWCFELKKAHDHTQSNCWDSQTASEIHKWKLVYKQRICSICLGSGHYWKNCEYYNPSSLHCTNCKAHHHENLGCRPSQPISAARNRD